MDTADDIAYAIHDLEDFHRVGVLQQGPVAAELGRWLHRRARARRARRRRCSPAGRRPGYSLERLRRRLHRRGRWIVDDDAFAAAVARVRAELVDGLLATPFDGSVEAEQAVGRFSAGWTVRLVDRHGRGGRPADPVRARAARARRSGTRSQVLKFVHQRFVLLRPDLALHQRGQARLLATLVEALEQWLADRYEADRLPRRLHDLVELAEHEYGTLAATDVSTLVGAVGEPPQGPTGIRELARGRAVIDFVASLTDSQAATLLDALSGRSAQPWSDAFVL